MAGSSNPPKDSNAYQCALNTNVFNVVSVKLEGNNESYLLWRAQMLCLMEAHEMCWLIHDSHTEDLSKSTEAVDGSDSKDLSEIIKITTSDSDTEDSSKFKRKYDSLLKGWIFGSVSEEVLRIVVDLKSSNDVWKKLEDHFGSKKGKETIGTDGSKKEKKDDKLTNKDPIQTGTKVTATSETDNVDSAKSEGKRDHATQTETTDSAQIKVDNKTETKGENENIEINYWRKLIANGNWYAVFFELEEKNDLTKKINTDGNTLLHIAVGKGLNNLTRDILRSLRNEDDLTKVTNAEGSTVLHIAAIVGNTEAAQLLVLQNKDLLSIVDKEGRTPLNKAYQNYHLDTIAYLLKTTEKYETRNKGAGDYPKRENVAGDETKPTHRYPPVETGMNLLVNAISAKRYEFALRLIKDNPEYATSKDNVLMALARTFPSGLDYGETLIYPSFDQKTSQEMTVKRTKRLFEFSIHVSSTLKRVILSILSCEDGYIKSLLLGVLLIPSVAVAMVYWMYYLILLLLIMVYIPFVMLYFLLWDAAAKVVPPIKNIEQKKKEYEQAKMVLEQACQKIIEASPGSSSSSENLFKGPILEAAREDAYEVVEEILQNWPEAIRCQDKDGHDIIQLATIHRSERIYNMIYILGDRKNLYRTMEDSSKNNMLHLAGKVAPPNKLKRITGAALQLQRELQWRQEVEKLVFPTYVNKVNILNETPEMLFTNEHKKMVKQGEEWMKNVADSCSITAALITTIVFAAAITVPGGSKDTGVPVFLKDIVFTIFAIADAISLFASATSLLVFLSILTARCSEEDFLLRLPRRLIIGLCTLLISTATMMVAFIATLFLVFCNHKKWMLAPICGLAFPPVAIFFVIQIPLIIDLFRSTYVSRFGKSDIKSRKFNPNVRLFFT